VRSSAFLYPWDVLGDPAAPARLAALGVRGVTLASAYHSTRALTPRHPVTRVVTAPHSAVYYPAAADRWSGQELRPQRQRWLPGEDPWGEAARALIDAGLEVASWVVLAHNSRLGGEFPQHSVRNAYGDRYPWALCVARPEVVRYCTELAVEAGVRPGAVGTELESCGWYGMAHLHAHDKIGGVQLDAAAQYVMSLCFCDVCSAGYAEAGVPDLDAAVRAALTPVWRGELPPTFYASGADEWSGVERLLGADLARLTLEYRAERARSLQQGCVRAVRAAAGPGFRIFLHADPAPHRLGSNAGVSPAGVEADGLVLPCTAGPSSVRDTLPALAEAAPGVLRAANLTVVSGMSGDPSALSSVLDADELRLYHAGLASDADLAEVGRQLAALATAAR